MLSIEFSRKNIAMQLYNEIFQQLLVCNPVHRIDAKTALRHDYFKGFIDC